MIFNKKQQVPDGLSHCALNITNRCNQRCIFCFEGDHDKYNHVSTEEVKKLIDNFIGKTAGVVFMGGEAILRKDFIEITNYAHSKGFWVDVFTNGQLLANKDKFNDIIKTNIKGIHISCNFHDETSFCEITGTSSKRWYRFLNTLENIGDFIRNTSKSKTKFTFDILVFKKNVQHLIQIIQLINKYIPLQETSFFIKMLQPYPAFNKHSYSEDFRVSTELLLKELTLLLNKYQGKTLFKFQGFPLCALPYNGEKYSVDMKRISNSYQVLSNFESQQTIKNMTWLDEQTIYPLRDLFAPICISCDDVERCLGLRGTNSWNNHYHAVSEFPIPKKINNNKLQYLKKLHLLDSNVITAVEKCENLFRDIIKIEKHDIFKANGQESTLKMFGNRYLLEVETEFVFFDILKNSNDQLGLNILVTNDDKFTKTKLFLEKIYKNLPYLHKDFFTSSDYIATWFYSKASFKNRFWAVEKTDFINKILNIDFDLFQYNSEVITTTYSICKIFEFHFNIIVNEFELKLVVTHYNKNDKYFLNNDFLGITHPEDSPIDTKKKRELVMSFFDFLVQGTKCY